MSSTPTTFPCRICSSAAAVRTVVKVGIYKLFKSTKVMKVHATCTCKPLVLANSSASVIAKCDVTTVLGHLKGVKGRHQAVVSVPPRSAGGPQRPDWKQTHQSDDRRRIRRECKEGRQLQLAPGHVTRTLKKNEKKLHEQFTPVERNTSILFSKPDRQGCRRCKRMKKMKS